MKITSKSLLAGVLALIGRSAKAQPIPPPSGGGGAAVWGDITGTLSAQTDLNSALGAKAPTASPTLTGTPAAPTATPGTNTTQIATTAFVLSAGPAGSSGDLQKKSGSAFAASVINDTAGAVTITPPAATAGPIIAGTTSTSTSAGNGAAAQEILKVQGADGQATTHNANNSQGGAGGQLRLIAGNGGDNTDNNATSASNHKAGDGGQAEIFSGAGGAGGTGHARGGVGGALSILGGQGGASSNDNGGAGATVTIRGGDAGSTGAAAVGGAGGGISIQAGAGGDTNGGTNGTGGSVSIDAGGHGSSGTGGADGVITIGTDRAASIGIGQSGITTTLNGNVAMPDAVAQPYLTLGGQAYGPLSAITKPPLVSALTWVNQGGATASNVGAGNAILMAAPGSSGDSIRYLHTASYPSTPFTFTVGFKLLCLNADFQIHGIALSDGTKFAAFGMGRNGSLGATAYTFATSTTGGVTIGSIPFTSLLPFAEVYISVADDGTTVTFKIGPDPLNMLSVGSASRATLGLTPTQVGIFLDPNNTNFPAQALFFHWAFS